MAARTAAEALRGYLAPMQRAASCVTRTVVLHDCRAPADGGTYSAAVGALAGVRVTTRGDHLRLVLQQRFRLSQDSVRPARWASLRTGYSYAVSDDDDREILAYHWHPGAEAFDPPHLHVSASAGTLRRELQRAHLPTGVISIEAFLSMAIREFGVLPLREDYRRVLDEPPPTAPPPSTPPPH